MKFGKTILSQQLPEYSPYYINYKALKKVIKSLAAGSENETLLDDNGRQQTRLQANKATFFFKLERELDKVNTFYLQKEAELRNRLTTLVDKRKLLQIGNRSEFRSSANFIVLQEGFQQFERDLNKLQQYVELNATGFYKALKKWDKRSKSHTKELYLSRRVEIQPVFDREILSSLVDTATAILLDLEAFASGDELRTNIEGKLSPDLRALAIRADDDLDTEILKAVVVGDSGALKDIVSRLVAASPNNASIRLTRIFMQALSDAMASNLEFLIDSGLIDFAQQDEISGRICIHAAVLGGRSYPVQLCLAAHSDLSTADVYGRTALHYACLDSRSMEDIVSLLLQNTAPVDVLDHNISSPLQYAIIQGNLNIVKLLLQYGADINPKSDADYIPLSMACSRGHTEIAELLLINGAKMLYNAEGLLPLHLVARAGHLGLVKLLCTYKADLEARDKFSGWSPVFFAASEGHIGVLQELIDCGALVSVRDEDHHSPTYFAAWEGHKAALQILLDAGGAFGNTESSVRVSVPCSSTSVVSADAQSFEDDGIPSLLLPPPILPVRSYGHNYLEKTTFLQISLTESVSKKSPVEWYLDETLFSSSKLTISLKSTRRTIVSELIPYTVSLPIIDEAESFTFQADDLQNMCLEFEIYPTYGSKVIAKGVAPPNLFRNVHPLWSDGNVCVIPLLDPRLQLIGQISFEFTLIKPFAGVQFDIHSRIDTYWKSTQTIAAGRTGSQVPPHHLVTESSLSGQYLWIPIQVSTDGIPFVFPTWRLPNTPIPVAVCEVNACDVDRLCERDHIDRNLVGNLKAANHVDEVQEIIASSCLRLSEFLAALQPQFKLHLQVLLPTTSERRYLGIRTFPEVNATIDSVLSIVFHHAEELKNLAQSRARSMFFSSSNSTICTALNWKQPNYPVFLALSLGPPDVMTPQATEANAQHKSPHGLGLIDSDRRCGSLKSAVKFAKLNNLLGVIIDAEISVHAPALIATIKQSGLVLITHGKENLKQEDVDLQTSHGVDGIQVGGICNLLHGIDT